MSINFFYDGKFDGAWLINSLVIVHDITNVFASIGYQLCSPPLEGTNHETLQMGKLGQPAA